MPENTTIVLTECENPNYEINQVDAHSFLLVSQRIKVGEYAFFQCRANEPGLEQHWCCSNPHAINKSKECVSTHHTEDTFNIIPGVDLSYGVFSGNTHCPLCDIVLTDIAYRFYITYATPYPSEMKDTGLCCTFEHAKTQSGIILDSFVIE